MKLLQVFSVIFYLVGITQIQAQTEFKFGELVYALNGKELENNQVYQYENISVLVKDISGYVLFDGKAELGLEVVITDNNSNRLYYTPDMLFETVLSQNDLENIKYTIDLSQDFIEGQEYYIKIRLWDKHTNKSFSKHSSFVIIESLRNDNVYIDVRRLKLSGYKIFANGDRLYKGNVIRANDEIVTELLFTEFKFEKDEDIIVITEIIDEQNSKTIRLKEEFVLAEKSVNLSTVLVKANIPDSVLVHGTTYVYQLQFHNASRNQKLDFKFKFLFLDKGIEHNTVRIPGVETKSYLNKQFYKGTAEVEIGDRLDFKLSGIEAKLDTDFDFCKVGASIALYDSKGNLIRKSVDLYRDFGIFINSSENNIRFNYTIPYDLEKQSKYTLELIVWDKYGDAIFTKRIQIRTSKKYGELLTLSENPNFILKYLDQKISLISTHVVRNNFKEFSNRFKMLDEISVVTACRIINPIKDEELLRIIQLFDSENNLLSQDEEDMTGFEGGEIYASIAIPEFGIEFNKPYKLVTILEADEDELLKVEYTFVVIK